MASANHSLTLWRLLDGKPGHEKQTLGLANALARMTHCQRIDIPVTGQRHTLLDWLLGRFRAREGKPHPDLILAAGHATHFAALAARRAHGGRIVLLMRPSLPVRWFDLCLIPEHDQPAKRRNIIPTQGALNAVTPSDRHDAKRGLFLIGGPSPHYRWDNDKVILQVKTVLNASPDIHWQLTTSRRTPSDFLPGLTSQLNAANLDILPQPVTPPGWLEQALETTGQTWVTEDSVSMVYEALTAGAPVGLIGLTASANSRVGQGIAKLARSHWLTSFDEWQQSGRLLSPPMGFDEAGRCAREILTRWPPNAN